MLQFLSRSYSTAIFLECLLVFTFWKTVEHQINFVLFVTANENDAWLQNSSLSSNTTFIDETEFKSNIDNMKRSIRTSSNHNETKKVNILNVHIIPHSHCDPGWLKIFEEYYSSNVHGILNGVFNELLLDENKTFNWAEISFFNMWWKEQETEKKEKIKALVRNGQIEFVGGGIVQHDEAVASLDVIIDQITEGHEFLLRNFNTRPLIAWQIDPFGHSSLTPELFSQMGYQAVVINRIHHSFKSAYRRKKSMEFVWRIFGKRELFTHVLHTHYSAPIGFDWEEGASVRITDENLESQAVHFVNTLKDRASSYQTSELLVPWGDDFKFNQASLQFKMMDMLIQKINSHKEDYGVHIFYSTPSRYFRAVELFSKNHPDILFPLCKHDFFPYADNEDSYWTGFYTSRPLLKDFHRIVLNAMRSAEVLFALARLSYSQLSNQQGNFLSERQLVAFDWDRQFRQLKEARWVTNESGCVGCTS